MPIAFAILAASAAIALDAFAIDDVYITYRYAASVAAGEGLRFNPGERVFGTTSPGMAVGLGAVAAATGWPVPELGAAATAVAVVVIASLLFLAAAGRGRAAEGCAAGLLAVGSPLVWVHVGSEVPVALALMMVAARLLARASHPAPAPAVAPAHVGPGAALVAGMLTGVAALCRPEALLGVALVPLVAVGARGQGLEAWRRTRRAAPRGAASVALVPFFAAVGAVVGGAALAAWAWFARLGPETLAVKRLHARWMPEVWPSGIDLWPAAARALVPYLSAGGLVALVLLGACGLPLLLRDGGAHERLLVLFALALLVGYPLLGVPMYLWYAIVPWLALAAGAAHAAGAAARWVLRSAGSRPARLAAAALGTAMFLAVAGTPAVRLVAFLSGEIAPVRYQLYRATGAWLRAHTGPAERVAAIEVGTIGFYAERPIHDLMGLVSRGARRGIAEGDLEAAFLAGRPDLLVARRPADPLLVPLEGAPWFAGAYREVARVRHRQVELQVIVYRRRIGTALPELTAPPARAASPVARGR